MFYEVYLNLIYKISVVTKYLDFGPVYIGCNKNMHTKFNNSQKCEKLQGV